MKMMGTAFGAAAKGNGKDAEGNPTPPDPAMMERMMSAVNPPPQPKGKTKKRMRKVAPGEWEVEETQQ